MHGCWLENHFDNGQIVQFRTTIKRTLHSTRDAGEDGREWNRAGNSDLEVLMIMLCDLDQGAEICSGNSDRLGHGTPLFVVCGRIATL